MRNDARIDSKEVARLSGLKRRTVTAYAARDLIPSARQFGTKWTFDADEIRAWVNGNGVWMTGSKTVLTTSTSAEKPIGSGRPSADENTVKAFAQLLSPSPLNRETPAS